MPRSALLLGASGLVGGHCLQLLLQDEAYDRVIILVRKTLPLSHSKLDQHAIDFEHLEPYAHLIKTHDVFCCLGTTIKQAGSQAAFRRVDFEYPFETAKIASRNGVEQFLLVTAMGASPTSAIFYNRVKGEVERAVSALAFRAVHIFRPSLLFGARPEFRLGEKIGIAVFQALSFLMVGPLRQYRAIAASAVAAAMINVAKQNRTGVNIFPSDQIQLLARAG